MDNPYPEASILKNKEAHLFHRVFNKRIEQLKDEIKRNSGNDSLKIKLKEVQNLYHKFYLLKKEKEN